MDVGLYQEGNGIPLFYLLSLLCIKSRKIPLLAVTSSDRGYLKSITYSIRLSSSLLSSTMHHPFNMMVILISVVIN